MVTYYRQQDKMSIEVQVLGGEGQSRLRRDRWAISYEIFNFSAWHSKSLTSQ